MADIYRDANTLVDEPPNILTPFRAGLNHRILIDDINDIPTNTKPYSVPDRYQEQLQKRLEQGLKDGIFYRTVSNKASPMFCTPKKDPTQARFVIDLRKRNSVTQHLPVDPGDQDHILHTLARARYRSAIDLKDGYPQVRIHPDDEKFAAFITPQGTFATRTMEQGDCNVLFCAIFLRCYRLLLLLVHSTCVTNTNLVPADRSVSAIEQPRQGSSQHPVRYARHRHPPNICLVVIFLDFRYAFMVFGFVIWFFGHRPF